MFQKLEQQANTKPLTAMEKRKAYEEANKDKIQAQKKAYNEANKEYIQARNKAYREANKDKIQERMKAYNETRKEQIQEHRKQYKEKQQQKHMELMETDPAYKEENKVVLCRLCMLRVKNKNWENHTQIKQHIFWQSKKHLSENQIKVNKWRFIQTDENTNLLEVLD